MEPASAATWNRLTWVVERDRVELLEAILGELGALAVSSADAGNGAWIETLPGEPAPWSRVQVQGLFPDTVDVAAVHDTAARVLGATVAHATAHGAIPGTGRGARLEAPEVETLADRDWVRESQRYARPRRFGARLWVCPTGSTLPDVSQDALVLRIDPGLGFGSGSHESTALCLEWLEARAASGSFVVDYGCGSGILGIAALLLGAASVRACDVDPHALDATRDNAVRNAVGSRLWVGSPNEMSGLSAEIIVANIMAATLCELAPTFAQLQGPGGELILSGILAEQIHDVEAAHAPWYDTELWRQRGDWVLVHARRRADSPPGAL